MQSNTQVIKALSNKTRLHIIKCIGNKPKDVTEIISNCGLAQSAVSQHLFKLKNAGIITAQKQGKHVFYVLKSPTALKIANLVDTLEKEIK